MTKAVKPRRRYDSPRRREQARATRGALLVAARALFIERGYRGTTIQSIAQRAELSPESVYATFGTKRALLSAVLNVSIVGDDEPVPLLARSWVREMRGEPDFGRRIAILARNGAGILERVSPIYEVLRGAAAIEPEIAALWEEYKSQRHAGQSELSTLVSAPQPYTAGFQASHTADVLFSIGSPEVHRLLRVDRGWSADQFERWYADALMRLLLP